MGAVLLCCRSNHPKVARALIRAGADLHAVTASEKYLRLGLFQMAAIHDAGATVEAIADEVGIGSQQLRTMLNAPADYGLTPLHLAALHHSHKAVRALLAAGASPHVKDAKGRTPMALCTSAEHRPSIQALQAAGAAGNSQVPLFSGSSGPTMSTPRDLLLRLPSLGPVTGILTPRGTSTPRGLAPLPSLDGSLVTPRARALPPLIEAGWAADGAGLDSASPSENSILTSTSSDGLRSHSGFDSTSSEEVFDANTITRRGAMVMVSTRDSREITGGSYSEGESPFESPIDDSTDESMQSSPEAVEARFFGRSVKGADTDLMKSPEYSEQVARSMAAAARLLEESGVWGDMDHEVAAMEESLRVAKQRSEGARAQCQALTQMGARHDVMLGRSPPSARSEAPKVVNVPKLNLGSGAPTGVPKLNLKQGIPPAAEAPKTRHTPQLSARLSVNTGGGTSLPPGKMSMKDLPSGMGRPLTARTALFSSKRPQVAATAAIPAKEDFDSLLADLDF